MPTSKLPLALLLVALLVACAPSDEGGRVLVLGLDGMDPDTVDLLMSEGKLPTFAKLRQEGAYGRLRSLEPLLSPIIWTTVATGKTADQHGIGHFVALAGDRGEEIPATSQLRRVEALWTIASRAGKEVATVGWWATWPPEEVDGWVVSDHTAYHFLFEDGLAGRVGAGSTWPPELAAEIAPLLRRPDDLTAAELAPFVDVPADELDRPFDFGDDLAHFRWALATAESYRDVGLKLWREKRPDLEMVYVEGTDSTSHLFGHLFRAEGLGGELAEQQQRYGGTVEAMYRFADRLLGEVVAAMDEDTTLVVLSDHGFDLGKLNDDPSKLRDLRRVSERFHEVEGILYLYGRHVRPGVRLDRASILDVAPTVLALLGLPAGEDMPGRVLERAFTAPLAPERIATWETGARNPADAGVEVDPAARAQLEHLRSLGYLGDEEASEEASAAPDSVRSPSGDSVLAALHFENGRYREAAGLYRELVAADPENATLRTSYAGALGALGLYDQALEQIARAVELDPLNVEAYHNRAVLHERRGDLAAAVADYRTALRYRPTYEPSRQALLRLTGQADPHSPASAAEAKAKALLDRAAEAARRTRYDEAVALLDEAERTAPDYVLVHQYRSNVAYLMGDRAAAIAALERALELEPENALFRVNLERLRSEGK